jgi:DnaD/phage-associated family protein
MGFIKSTASIDLGDTPIENIFIDVYMPMANGTFVKVYLLGYKYSCDSDLNKNVTNLTIAKNLNIPLSDVLSAWDFWENKKIIKKHFISEENEIEYSVEFFNLKQIYIDNNYKTIYSLQSENIETESYTCSAADLISANKVPEIKEMFNEINKIIDRPLVPNEKMQILEWFYSYNIDPPLIVKAYHYCKHKKNVKQVKYIGAVLRNWYDIGISNLEQLQEHLLKQGEKYGMYDRVFKAMGFSYRQPSESEMLIMDKWIDEYKFDMEIILKACENSSKTSNPNINYIHSILSDWYGKGIKQTEDIEINDSKRNILYADSGQKKLNKIKTKFHLSKSRLDKYSSEELNQIILNNQKKKSQK